MPAGQDSVTGSSGGGGSMPGDPWRPGPARRRPIAPEDPCGQTVTSGTGPDASVSYTPCSGEPIDPIGHAQDVVPTPGMSDVRPTGWIKATVGPDDRTVTLRFWSGVEPCYVLDHVDVAYAADGVTITLFQGSDPSAQGRGLHRHRHAEADDDHAGPAARRPSAPGRHPGLTPVTTAYPGADASGRRRAGGLRRHGVRARRGRAPVGRVRRASAGPRTTRPWIAGRSACARRSWRKTACGGLARRPARVRTRALSLSIPRSRRSARGSPNTTWASRWSRTASGSTSNRCSPRWGWTISR